MLYCPVTEDMLVRLKLVVRCLYLLLFALSQVFEILPANADLRVYRQRTVLHFIQIIKRAFTGREDSDVRVVPYYRQSGT